jgi:uncharacterized SAM-binding protein YcdF (DUF218 family)
MDLVMSKTLALWLLPPGVFVLVILLGLLIHLKWRWLGIAIITLSAASLFALSTPQIGRRLLASLEAPYPPLPALTAAQARARADAIVVLGGGRSSNAPEYGDDTVNADTLVRLRYAARLHRATKLPILVSGGSVFGEQRTEADLMSEVLERDFGVNAKWIEHRSRTTYENAAYAKALLAEAKIQRVLLVTSAWHMARAEWAFIEHSLVPVPAPTGYTMLSEGDRGLLGVTPSGLGLRLSSIGLHERLGLFWYKTRQRTEQVLPDKEKRPAAAD